MLKLNGKKIYYYYRQIGAKPTKIIQWFIYLFMVKFVIIL